MTAPQPVILLVSDRSHRRLLLQNLSICDLRVALATENLLHLIMSDISIYQGALVVADSIVNKGEHTGGIGVVATEIFLLS